MLIEAKTVPEGFIEADICIVGSGAAGIACALEFRDSPLNIVMLESGPLEDTALGDDPTYEVEATELSVANQSRRRGFGGTMTRWAGKWKRPDLIDFSPRPWVPLSGWPVSRDSLDPYYERASNALHAPNLLKDFSAPTLLGGTAFEPTPFLVQHPQWINWGKTFADTFRQAKNITVHVGAHVTRLIKTGGIITEARVRSDSREYIVRAKLFVLACGGIENARLLFISDIGNEHDQVGRYYMDHPKGRCGVVDGYRPVDLKGCWDVGGSEPFFIGLRLSDEIQRKEQILNSHIFLEPAYESTLYNKITRRIFGRTASPLVVVRNYLEQAPVATNRVTLSTEQDAFGLPKARVEWNISDLDKKTITVLHGYLKDELEKADIGSLHSPLLDTPAAPFPITEDAYHHMGTTRMGTSLAVSVVDPDCKIHTADNLFVAGKRCSPPAGTLTQQRLFAHSPYDWRIIVKNWYEQ